MSLKLSQFGKTTIRKFELLVGKSSKIAIIITRLWEEFISNKGFYSVINSDKFGSNSKINVTINQNAPLPEEEESNVLHNTPSNISQPN